MSGFDLPPISGLDGSFKLPQGPTRSPEVFKIPEIDPSRAIGEGEQSGAGVGSSSPFDGVLADSIGAVRDLQLEAKDKVRGMVLGEDVELHDVMIAGKKSEVAFNLLLEVRNKMMDAWEKLSRSSV